MAKEKRKRSWWRRLLNVILIGGAVYVVLMYALAYKYLHPQRLEVSMPSEATPVTIPNKAFEAPAWATGGLASKSPKSKTVFVLVHGYGGSRDTWNETFADLAEKGYEVVVPAMPAHEESRDSTTGFGIKESDLVVSTMQWVKSRYKKEPKIILVGVSMGGAACWLASEKAPDLPDVIITESAFARLDEAVDRWFSMLLPGGPVILRPVIWFASAMSGVQPANINPVDAARKWHGRPSLVIQAAKDELVVPSHGARLAGAAGCDLWLIPEAAHAYGYSVARADYLARLVKAAESQ